MTPRRSAAAAALLILSHATFGQPPKTDAFGDPLPAGAIARLGTIRHRHIPGAPIVFLPDGKTLREVDASLTVTDMDAADGRVLRSTTLPAGLTGEVMKVSLSADGHVCAVHLSNGTIDVWDLATNKRLRSVPKSDQFSPRELALSPDGRRIAVAGYARGLDELRIWDLATGADSSIDAGRLYFQRLAFLPDSKRLIWYSGRVFRCWDTVAGKELWSHTVEGVYFPSFAVSPSGRTIVLAAQRDRKLIRLDAQTGAVQGEVEIKTANFLSVSGFVGEDHVAVTYQQRDSSVQIWDSKLSKEVLRLDAAGAVLATARDAKSVVGTDAAGGVLMRWDLATGKPMWADTRDRGHTGDVYRLVFSPDGRTLASCSEDGSVRIWDVDSGRTLHTIRERTRDLWSMTFSADGRSLFTAGSGEIVQWNAMSGKEVRRLNFDPNAKGRSWVTARSLAVTADNSKLCAILSDGEKGLGTSAATVVGWNLSTGQECFRREEAFVAYDTAISPHAEVYVNPSGTVVDTKTGSRRTPLQIPGGLHLTSFTSPPVAFSSSGQIIAGQLARRVQDGARLWTEYHGVQLWDALTGAELQRLGSGHLGCISLSSNGRILAGADMDALYIWDTVTGQEVLRRPAPARVRGKYTVAFASTISFSPDGRILATGLPNSTVLLWKVPQPTALPKYDLRAAVADLGSEDAQKAWAAIWHLAGSPNDAIPLLRNALKPIAPIPADRLKGLIADLDAPQFAKREAAAKALAEFGEQAEPALREALAGQSSAETRKRIDSLLSALYPPPTRDMLRQLRGVEALEIMATPEARELLGTLAAGDPAARQTKAAKAALERSSARK